MIPCTDSGLTTTHLPYPMLTNLHYMTTSVHEPRVLHTTSVPSRRGRRSNVPPEIREQTRRLKKQNMERRRRACISDKMNALHNLALSLVGVDPQESPKVEKADILSICYSVFEGIAKIAKDDPELKFRLHNLRNCLREPSTSSSNQPNALHLIDETTRSSSCSTVSEDSCSRTNSPLYSKPITPILRHHSTDYENKENYVPSSLCTIVPMNKISSPSNNTPLLQPLDQWHSTPLTSIKHHTQQSSDSGFQSIQDRSMSHLIQSNYEQLPLSGASSSLNSSRLGQLPQPNQDHRFSKPKTYPISCQNRSAFTPIRQTKTSPNPVFTTPPPPPRSTLQSSSLSSAESRTTSANTTMWRPYLD